MDKNKRQPPSRAARAISAMFSGFLLGAINGALISASLNGDNPLWLGALVGGVLFGASELITDLYRSTGQMKPLWYRIPVSAFFGAGFTALLTLLIPGLNLIALGFITGLLAGIFGFQLNKLLLGTFCGLAAGVLTWYFYPSIEPALLGALVVLSYRIFSALLFPGQIQFQLMAERVPAEDVRYVVPFEASSKYVGADYFKDLARAQDGSFKRNAPGIGIVESMDSMRGPEFDPAQVHPLVREFYEHTSRFKLNIRPRWKNSIKPLF